MDDNFEIKVLSPGLLTTVQDQGRIRFRAHGVPESGPMDAGSAQLANMLVGNQKFNPVLEFTIKGPILKLVGRGLIAVTGGRFELNLDQNPISQEQAFEVNGVHTLSIGSAQTGCRGYLAAAGKWQIQSWLQSCSTATQNAAELTPDSRITRGSTIAVQSGTRAIPNIDIPAVPSTSGVIRIIAGPEYHLINTTAIKELLQKSFTISSQSNRMGYRLENRLSNYSEPIEIISSGVVPGTVQLTDSGQLIVLMADAQTTGGYPRVANVLSADLDLLGQMKPGDRFRFKLVSFNEAFGGP